MTKTKKIPGTRLQAWLSGPSEKFQPLQAVRSPYKHGGRDLEKGRGTLVIPWKQPCQVKAAQGRGCRDWKWPSACGWRACRNDSGPSGRLCEGRGSQGARCGHRSLSCPHPPRPPHPPHSRNVPGADYSDWLWSHCPSQCSLEPHAAPCVLGPRGLLQWPGVDVQFVPCISGLRGAFFESSCSSYRQELRARWQERPLPARLWLSGA